MPPTRTSCPRCRQPVTAEITQLFDTNQDPQAKQKILSGQYNLVNCPSCGYQGNLPSPLVYHDPDKELLLTFFPPELGLPVNEQEKLIGPLITQAVNKLPAEKRKGYLLRPQTMFTMKLLIEKVLEGEGITKEMIERQEKQVGLIREMMTTSDELLPSVITREPDLIDEGFFNLFSHLIESAAGASDKASVEKLAAIEKHLLEHTSIGREMKQQAEEAEAAVKSLQEASKDGLTREKLLELVVTAPGDARLAAIVRMTRSGLDYAFFQMLTDRIVASAEDEKNRLTIVREKILAMIETIDRELETQASQMDQLLEKILTSNDIPRVMEQILPAINEIFVQVLRAKLEAAQKSNDQGRLTKLNQIVDAIQKASAPPAEYALVEQLLDAPDEAAMEKLLDAHPELVTPELCQLIPGLLTQAEDPQHPEDPRVIEKLRQINRILLKRSMRSGLMQA